VDIGVKMRQRYMLQRKNSRERSEDELEYIKEANTAAHGLSGLADSALFTLGIWSGRDYGPLFEKIYRTDPADYVKENERWKSLIDFVAILELKIEWLGDLKGAKLLIWRISSLGPMEDRENEEEDNDFDEGYKDLVELMGRSRLPVRVVKERRRRW
jgi:hypothetical protein